MFGAKLIIALAGVLGGYLVGAVALPMRSPVACIDALDRADQLMNDMATFGKSSLSGIGAVLVGGKYDANTDPAYVRIMAETAPYKSAAAACRR